MYRLLLTAATFYTMHYNFIKTPPLLVSRQGIAEENVLPRYSIGLATYEWLQG